MGWDAAPARIPVSPAQLAGDGGPVPTDPPSPDPSRQREGRRLGGLGERIPLSPAGRRPE